MKLFILVTIFAFASCDIHREERSCRAKAVNAGMSVENAARFCDMGYSPDKTKCCTTESCQCLN